MRPPAAHPAPVGAPTLVLAAGLLVAAPAPSRRRHLGARDPGAGLVVPAQDHQRRHHGLLPVGRDGRAARRAAAAGRQGAPPVLQPVRRRGGVVRLHGGHAQPPPPQLLRHELLHLDQPGGGDARLDGHRERRCHLAAERPHRHRHDGAAGPLLRWRDRAVDHRRASARSRSARRWRFNAAAPR